MEGRALRAGRAGEARGPGKGTDGVTPPPAPNAAQLAQRTALAKVLKQSGWSPGLCYLVASR